MDTGPPHVVPLEYVCTVLSRMGFKMINYFIGEDFSGLSNEIENMRREMTDVYKENAYLFAK